MYAIMVSSNDVPKKSGKTWAKSPRAWPLFYLSRELREPGSEGRERRERKEPGRGVRYFLGAWGGGARKARHFRDKNAKNFAGFVSSGRRNCTLSY